MPRVAMSHQAKVYSLAGRGDILCSGSADRSIKVWDVRSSPASPVIATLNGHTRSVWSLKFAPPPVGEVLLSSGNDGNVNLWDMRTWTSQRVFNNQNEEALAVECSPDGSHIFAGSSTSKVASFAAAGILFVLYAQLCFSFFQILVWERESGELVQQLAGHQWEVWQLERLGDMLLSASYDHKLMVRSTDAQSGFALLKTLDQHKGAVHSLKACGSRFAFSGSGDKCIRLWG